MRRTSRPLLLASGLALGVAAASSIATTSAAQNLEPVLEKITLESSYVLLDTATDQVTSTVSSETQTIIEGCSLDVVLDPADTLLSIRPGSTAANGPADKLGYGKSGIGVAGRQDKGGTRCADVDFDYGQSLIVELGTQAGLARAANLDLELKFGAVVNIEAFVALPGEAPMPVDLTSPDGVDEADGSITYRESDFADDGPDSKDGDNYRVQIEAVGAYFSGLRLTPLAGSFALEGGGDGTRATDADQAELLPGTTASVFEVLGEGALQCDEDDADGVTESGVNVIFTDCASGEVVPYFLDRDTAEPAGDGVVRDRVLLGVPESQDNTYIVRIPWEPEAAQLPLPATEVAFFTLDGAPQYQAIDWCGVVEGSTPVQPYLPADQDVLAEFDGAQGACLISQNAAIGEGDGEVQIIERILLVGDPAFGRLR
jgi:hypothetical protein